MPNNLFLRSGTFLVYFECKDKTDVLIMSISGIRKVTKVESLLIQQGLEARGWTVVSEIGAANIKAQMDKKS